MIKFMVIAAPRSGTAWAAEWLTTEQTHCIHDPLTTWLPAQLDKIEVPDKLVGVSCTALALFPGWVNKHPAPKVILHRPQSEVSASLRSLGMPDSFDVGMLTAIDGLHLPWTALFDTPRRIWEHLLKLPFDVRRHTALKTQNIQHAAPEISPEHLRKIRCLAQL